MLKASLKGSCLRPLAGMHTFSRSLCDVVVLDNADLVTSVHPNAYIVPKTVLNFCN